MIHLKINGIDELKRKLGGLAPALVDRDIHAALSDALKPVRDEARSLVTKGTHSTGKTAALIEIEPGDDHKANVVTAEVTLPKAGEKELAIATALERGTRHRAAKPFMRPALDGKKDEAIGILGRRVGAAIERIMNK